MPLVLFLFFDRVFGNHINNYDRLMIVGIVFNSFSILYNILVYKLYMKYKKRNQSIFYKTFFIKYYIEQITV